MTYWTPPPMHGPPAGDDPILMTIGDISCTRNFVIVPEGMFPIRGTSWTVNNQTYFQQETPSWAIILAIVGFFFVCVFSLFFLLAKETRHFGYLDVTVTGPNGLHHTTRMMAPNYLGAAVDQQVNYARSLSVAA